MHDFKPLTKYPIGSLREICKLSFPLMLMTMSIYVMHFADRLILARFSLEAMSAAAVAGMWYVTCTIGFWSLALISEVFVGQYNGSKQYKKIGGPVWQMVWFVFIGYCIVLLPLGLFAGPYFIKDQFAHYGVPYFKILMLLSLFFPMSGSLSAFYIGRGKTLVVTLVVALANILNVILNYIFVFGVKGWVSSMGPSGAAWSTGISQFLQFAIFLILILLPQNRLVYGTGQYKLNWSLLKKCLKFGLPNSISICLVLLAWTLFFKLLGQVGEVYLATLTLAHSYFVIFMFISDGLGKAVMALCSNLIGGDQLRLIPKVIQSSLTLHLISAAILSIPLVFFSDPLVTIFMANNPSAVHLEGLLAMADRALTWTWWSYLFNGLVWIFMCQLIAAGDTKFTLYANAISAWGFLIIPAYVLIKIFSFSPEVAWQIMALDLFVASVLFILRFAQGKWKSIAVIDKEKSIG